MKKSNLILVLVSLFIVTNSVAQSLTNTGVCINVEAGTYVAMQGSSNVLHNKLGATINLKGNLELDVVLTNDGTFNIENTGNLIDNGTINGTNAQQFNVKQNVAANETHLFSIPVSGSLSNIFAGSFVNSYNEINDSWNALTNGQTLLSTTGYSVQSVSDGTINFVGMPNTANQQINVTKTTEGWNLLGNPFAATIDWEDAANILISNVSPTVYFWNGSTFATYTRGGQSTNGATQYIPKMQGFFVKTVQPSVVYINAGARTFVNQNFYKNENEVSENLKLKVSNNIYSDETIINFNSESSNNFDNESDASKLFSLNAEVPQIFSYCEGERLVINSLPEVSENLIIPIGFKAGKSGNYNLEFSENQITNQDVYIEDLKTKTIILKSELPYNFLYNTLDNENRFNILFAKNVTDINNLKSGINIYSTQNEVYVQLPENSFNANIEIIDITGKIIYSENVVNQLNKITLNQASGIYIVKVKTNNLQKIEKLEIIK